MFATSGGEKQKHNSFLEMAANEVLEFSLYSLSSASDSLMEVEYLVGCNAYF